MSNLQKTSKKLRGIRRLFRRTYGWFTKTRRRKILSSILAILMLFTSIRFAFFKPKEVRAWWDDNWNYRQKVIVSNAGSEQTNFQVGLSFDTATPISAGKLRSDCADIRILDINGMEITDPWWLDTCNNTGSTIWVKFATVPTTDFVVYIYYGNPSATNSRQSSGDDVFEFFDDFAGTSIDTTKWTITNSSGWSVNNGELKGTDTTGRLTSVPTFSQTTIFETKYRYISNPTRGFMPGGFFTSTTNGFGLLNYPGTDYYRNNGGWTAINNNDPSNTNLLLTITAESSSNVDLTLVKFEDGTSYQNTTDVNNDISNEPIVLGKRYDNSYAGQGYEAYWDWIYVRKYASTEPSAALSSEEVGPGPVAHWKFDEGYGQTIESPITVNEQQINILDREYYTSFSTFRPTDNSLGLIHWDADRYPGATVYFEAVARLSDPSGQCGAVALYSEAGTEISAVTIGSTSFTRYRSSALSLTDDTNYTARVREGPEVPCTGNAYIRSARLIIIQSDTTKITDTQAQVEIGAVEKQASDTPTQLTNKKIYYYDSTKFTPTPTAYFEATLRNSQPTIEQQLNIIDQEYITSSSTFVPTDNSLGLIHWDADKYPGATVYFEAVARNTDQSNQCGAVGIFNEAGSEIGTVIVQGTGFTRYRSTALSLADDTNYTARVREASYVTCTGSTYIRSAHLVVIQTDTTKITDTQAQIEVGNEETGFTNETYSDLTDEKIYLYDENQFSPVPTASFSASLKIDNSGDTVYAQLFNCGNPCNPASGQQVAEVSHTGDTNWTLITTDNIHNDADWDSTNDDEYIVRIKCTDGGVDGCSGNIANAKITLDQFSGSGITDLETVQQQINTATTDADDTYSNTDYLNWYNLDLETSMRSFAGGTVTYYYESTLKTSAGTGYARLYNRTNSSVISNSEVTTTNASYTLVRSGDITADLPQYPQDAGRNLDTQLKNFASDTTTASSSWMIVQVSGLAASGVTAYADLYNITDSTQVTNSEVSTTSTSWTRVRSNSITLTTDKEYVVRTSTSYSGAPIHMINAKLVLDQTDASGVKAVETVHTMVNNVSTDSDTGYTDQNFINQYNPSNNNILPNYNSGEIHFEATMKTSTGGGSDDAFAILTVDGGSTVSGSELTTDSTDYARVITASSITANMPTSATNMDTQIKNESGSATSSVSSSWMIIQNNNTLPSGTHDSTLNANNGNIAGASWQTECEFHNCLDFDGTDDFVIAADNSKLDFAETDDFTITAWFKHIEQTSGTDVILAKYETTGSDGGYKVQMESDGDISFGVDDDNTWGPDDAATSTNATYDDNSWHHIAAVKDGTTSISLYIDGLLVATDDNISATATLANDDPVYIGIDGDGSSNPFDGLIDEVKIYPYARTAAEIKTDYIQNAGPHGSSAVFGIKDDARLYEGLLGYWKLDESSGDASDSSGNGTTLTNTNTVVFNASKFGNGAEFNGTTQYFDAVDNTALSVTGDLTLSAWIKPDDISGSQDIVGKLDDADESYMLALEGGEVRMYVDSSSNYEETSGTPISANTLTHVAGVYNSAAQTVTLYVNGSIEASDTDGGTIPSSIGDDAGEFSIGAEDTGGALDNYFDGHIDEVRVYNRILSPAEVLQLYKWAPGPVGYWKMDEGTGTSAYDTSGNNNTGNFSGSPKWKPGKYGSSIADDIDGVSDELVVSDPASGILDFSDTDDFSYEVWLKIESQESYVIPIWKGGSNVNNDGYDIEIDNTNGYAHCLYIDGNGSGSEHATGVSDLRDSQWHHIACVMDRDGSEVGTTGFHLFRDGILEDSDTTLTEGSAASNSDDLRLMFDDSAVYEFEGAVDNAMIFNYARTQEQIIEDMNAGHPAPGSPVGSSVLHLKFDEGYGDTANDSSPQGNDGDLAGSCPGGATCPSWTNSGKFGKALSFDGSDDYVTVTDPGYFDNVDSLTISYWFNATDWAGGGDYNIMLEKRGASQAYVFQGKIAGSTELEFYLTTGAGQKSAAIVSDMTTIEGEWHHATAVYDGSYIKTYLDGGWIESTTQSGTVVDNAADLSIGGRTDTTSEYHYNGRLDEVKFYNFALTEDQIKLEYNQGAAAVFGATSTDSSDNPSWSALNEYCPPGQGSSCTGPMAHWPLDKHFGTSSVSDISGNGKSLTMLGSMTEDDWVHGKIGSALEFDGDNDYLYSSDATYWDFGTSTAFTIEAWVRLDSTDGADSYITAASSNGTNARPEFLYNDASSALQITIGYTTWCGLDGTTDIEDGQWHHVVAVANRNATCTTNDLLLYVDGVQESTTLAVSDGNSDANIDLNSFMVGRDTSKAFHGPIDDVKIFNYARTPAQIAWSYNRGGPIHWYKFDECQGTTIYDSGSTGVNGTLTIASPGSDNEITSVGTCNSGVTTEAWNVGTNGKRNASIGLENDDGDDDTYVDDYATVSNSNFPTDDFTVAAWIYLTNNSADFILHAPNNTASENEFGLRTIKVDNIPYLRITVDDSSSKTGDTVINLNTWHHVAATRDGSTVKLYVDGKLDGEMTESATLDFGTCTNFFIGTDVDGTGCTASNQGWTGQIDEVQIYNYALTQQQINDIYNSGAVYFGQ